MSLLAGAGDLTATEAVRAVASGAMTVSDVATACLQRARVVEPQVGAFRVLDEAAVEHRAKELEAATGALKGVMVGVKDVIDTADTLTGYGSPLFADHQPVRDADIVTRLRDAGALVFGKTESTEFAMFHPTRTRNPVDTARTPGGSSSGSAAAVAAGVVPVALGTQTAGSVIRPAAYCGVYGFKPARGWTPTDGVWLLSGSLDTVGLFARRVADLDAVYRAVTGRRGRVYRGPSGHRAALLRTDPWGKVEPAVEAALAATCESLRRAAWEITDMALPQAWRDLPGCHVRVMAAEVAYNLTRSLGDRIGQVSESTRQIIEQGRSLCAPDYLSARAATDEAISLLGALEASFDLLIAPSALGIAPEGLDFTGDPVMCRPWTLLGLPAANVPGTTDASGLPVGVQAIAPHFDDLAFLDDLASVEAALTDKE